MRCEFSQSQALPATAGLLSSPKFSWKSRGSWWRRGRQAWGGGQFPGHSWGGFAAGMLRGPPHSASFTPGCARRSFCTLLIAAAFVAGVRGLLFPST